MKHLTASTTPKEDIAKISYVGQDPKMKMYRSGYENYFNEMPVITNEDPLLSSKAMYSKGIMQALGEKLKTINWLTINQPSVRQFWRTIVAMESPVADTEGQWKEGAEFVVAQWGDEFSSPVHGHATGYMHEQVLMGKIVVTTYRIINEKQRIVRPVLTEIFKAGDTFVSTYVPHESKQVNQRRTLVHNFKSIGYSATLHYLPEHTRDGRDNGFQVEVFYPLAKDIEKQLTAQEGITQLNVGDVALVRSSNVSDYGDHFIVITGSPVLKEHGLRPQDIVIGVVSDAASEILDKYIPIQGLTLLKLNQESAKEFFNFTFN